MEISTTGIAGGLFFSKVPYPTSDTSQWEIGLCLDKKKHPEVLCLPDVSYLYLLSGLVSTQPAAPFCLSFPAAQSCFRSRNAFVVPDPIKFSASFRVMLPFLRA